VASRAACPSAAAAKPSSFMRERWNTVQDASRCPYLGLTNVGALRHARTNERPPAPSLLILLSCTRQCCRCCLPRNDSHFLSHTTGFCSLRTLSSPTLSAAIPRSRIRQPTHRRSQAPRPLPSHHRHSPRPALQGRLVSFLGLPPQQTKERGVPCRSMGNTVRVRRPPVLPPQPSHPTVHATSDCDAPFNLVDRTLKWIEKHWADEVDFVVCKPPLFCSHPACFTQLISAGTGDNARSVLVARSPPAPF
jgi:hypothetical protein